MAKNHHFITFPDYYPGLPQRICNLLKSCRSSFRTYRPEAGRYFRCTELSGADPKYAAETGCPPEALLRTRFRILGGRCRPMGGEDLRIPTSTWDDTPYPRIFLINDPESGLLGSDQAPILACCSDTIRPLLNTQTGTALPKTMHASFSTSKV